jgi:hypothetical protein
MPLDADWNQFNLVIIDSKASSETIRVSLFSLKRRPRIACGRKVIPAFLFCRMTGVLGLNAMAFADQLKHAASCHPSNGHFRGCDVQAKS